MLSSSKNEHHLRDIQNNVWPHIGHSGSATLTHMLTITTYIRLLRLHTCTHIHTHKAVMEASCEGEKEKDFNSFILFSLIQGSWMSCGPPIVWNYVSCQGHFDLGSSKKQFYHELNKHGKGVSCANIISWEITGNLYDIRKQTNESNLGLYKIIYLEMQQLAST